MQLKVYGTETKKMLNILILEILKDYSDMEHHLTQQEIMRKLKADYGIEKIDRRSVKANVISLRDMGYEIGGLDEDDPDNDGYYLEEREFEDEELRILIDSVLFSKTLSDSAAKKLIEKLRGFGNIYFDTKVSHVKPTPLLHRTDNKSVLYNVSAINEAMDDRYTYKLDRSAERARREANEIGIQAVRGGTIVGEHEVLFCGPDEVIEIKHTAYSKAIFGKGAIQAAQFLKGKKPGMYQMSDVIG